MTTPDHLATLLRGASARAAQLEQLARQPYTVLGTHTTNQQATAWAAKQGEEAAAIRAAIEAFK